MTQLEALLLSLLIEVPAVLLVARLHPSTRATPGSQLLLAAVAATLMTHPVAWWLNTVGLRPLPFATRAALIEVGVVIAEGGLFAAMLGWRLRLALGVSALANAASFAMGLASVRAGWL